MFCTFKVDEILSRQRYIAGSEFTEADIRLFVTLIRFDPVYVLHFKCNRKRIVGKIAVGKMIPADLFEPR